MLPGATEGRPGPLALFRPAGIGQSRHPSGSDVQGCRGHRQRSRAIRGRRHGNDRRHGRPHHDLTGFNGSSWLGLVGRPRPKRIVDKLGAVVTQGRNEPTPRQGLVSQGRRAGGRFARRMGRLRRVRDQARCAHLQGDRRQARAGTGWPTKCAPGVSRVLPRCFVTTALPSRRHQAS